MNHWINQGYPIFDKSTKPDELRRNNFGVGALLFERAFRSSRRHKWICSAIFLHCFCSGIQWNSSSGGYSLTPCLSPKCSPTPSVRFAFHAPGKGSRSFSLLCCFGPYFRQLEPSCQIVGETSRYVNWNHQWFSLSKNGTCHKSTALCDMLRYQCGTWPRKWPVGGMTFSLKWPRGFAPTLTGNIWKYLGPLQVTVKRLQIWLRILLRRPPGLTKCEGAGEDKSAVCCMCFPKFGTAKVHQTWQWSVWEDHPQMNVDKLNNIYIYIF